MWSFGEAWRGGARFQVGQPALQAAFQQAVSGDASMLE